MRDIEILEQLLKGNHLNEKELKRAKELNKLIEIHLTGELN